MITDLPLVDDDIEQFPAREEEEVTETEISREDPVMQISGTGHCFWKVGSATIQ